MSIADPGRLGAAVTWAATVHAGQTRKGSDIPYASHLLAVAALVVEHGGDEDAAIAALCHDSVEDRGRVPPFGARVRRIVADCTDLLPGDTPASKSPWTDRKARYLDSVSTMAEDSLLVAACDKVHNLESLLDDLRRDGPATLGRFTEKDPARQLWFFRTFSERACDRLPARLAARLRRGVAALDDALSGAGA